jgi:hypothetical protein
MSHITKHDLTVNELLLLQSELRNQSKSLGIGYLMLLGGHLGVHRFYVKRYGSGITQLILFLSATAAYFLAAAIGIALELTEEHIVPFIIIFTVIPAIVLFIWVVVDLFLMPRMIREWNQQVERNTIDQIVALRPKEPA